ncbi:PREDICTED: carboxyl-terminal-processing peptidase 2, chloroplastic-like [Populus euphratica]|uniref:Carboxyl-terminal-processing peptidase 2, chloroplastic-like n=1 Tax=Populus euphratica TaxID=75702 RepID=A0AAJ6UIJ9_POPEU|nr:PREDICTED: carboxyl-terminal-processing peptidase 2, chloroplastic-like [Populus euphratica]
MSMEVVLARSPFPRFSLPNTNLKTTLSSSNSQVLLWRSPLMNVQLNHYYSRKRRGCINGGGASRRSLWPQFSSSYDRCNLTFGKCISRLQEFMNSSEKMRKHVSSTLFTRLVVSVLMVSFAVSNSPSWALSEENLLFLEAWRTIDRAFVDKTFNGQSWFRYRENALRNEPMNTREETCMVLFLKSIHSSLFRELLLSRREKVSLNPVKSRLCVIPGSGKDSPRIGYIKLTTFNQNASGAIREAINTLRSNNVNAFVLDLRDNSGGLFPEGIEIAKIWLDKGVIVYICDSRGVRDIYDTDGSSAIATSEPLAVLVNKGTASASEILAGALKDNKRAVLFGEPTFGKGKIQSVFQLSDGSGLAVTVARYETPDHTDIDKVGVIPDHPLPRSFPKDEEGFCGCLQDPASTLYVNRGQLFAR